MRKRLLVASGLLLTVLGLAVTAGGAYAYLQDESRADVIAAGISIAGVQVGGLKAQEARALLTREVVAPLSRPLRLDAGTWTTTISRRDAGLRVDVAAMVRKALAAGRHEPFDQRLLQTIRGGSLDVAVPLAAEVSTRALARVLGEVTTEVDKAPRPARVFPSATRLRIVPSRDGVRVDAERLWRSLRRALLDPNTNTVTVPTRVLRPRLTTANIAKHYPSFLLVDREHYKLRLYRHLKLARVYDVAVGRAGLETPAGLYHINDREVNPPWRVPLSSWAGSLAGKTIPPGPADPIKARWLGFYDGAGIHGTDEYWSIGHAASHGCIRMRIEDVIALYPLVPMGTPIYVA